MKARIAAFAAMTAVAGLSLGTPAWAQTTETQDERCALVLKGEDALPAETLTGLNETPNIILSTYPAGGAVMIPFVAKAVASEFDLMAKILGLVPQATPLQQSAIGFALAQASKLYEAGGCVENVGAIAEAVAATGNQRVIDAFDEGVGGVPAAIGTGPGGPGGPGGPVGASGAVASSDAPDVAGGTTGQGLTTSGGGGGTVSGGQNQAPPVSPST